MSEAATEFADALAGQGARVDARLIPSSRAAIPWVLATLLAIALVWIGVRGERASVPATGPVRFGVEFDDGVMPSFTPIVRLSADRRQLLSLRWSSAARKSFAARSIASGWR